MFNYYNFRKDFGRNATMNYMFELGDMISLRKICININYTILVQCFLYFC